MNTSQVCVNHFVEAEMEFNNGTEVQNRVTELDVNSNMCSVTIKVWCGVLRLPPNDFKVTAVNQLELQACFTLFCLLLWNYRNFPCS